MEQRAPEPESFEHITSPWIYVFVLIALLGLTMLSWGLSYVHMRYGAMAVTFLIAVVQVSLLFSVYMHLKWDSHVFRGALALAFFLGSILFGLSAVDWIPREANKGAVPSVLSWRVHERGVK